MSRDIRTPNCLNFSSRNMAVEWRNWYDEFYMYMIASKLNKDDETVKVATLINLMGRESLAIYKTFKHEKETFDSVVKLFSEHFEPKKNIVYERFKFYKYKSECKQNISQYVTALKTLAESCEFKEKENMVRDKIVIETIDDTLRYKLLSEEDLDLEKTVQMCLNHEILKNQSLEMKQINANVVDDVEVDLVRNKPSKSKFFSNRNNSYKYKCFKCGQEHVKAQCPAYGRTCSYCGYKNHFSVGCPSKNRKDGRKNRKSYSVEIDKSESDDSSDNDGDIQVNEVRSSDANKDWLQTAWINETPVNFKIDSGSDIDIIPLRILKNIFNNRVPLMKPVKDNIVAFGNNKLKPIGQIKLKTLIRGKQNSVKYVVIDVQSKPILGLKSSIKFNLIKRIDNVKLGTGQTKEDLTKKFKSVFEGIGKFPGPLYHIKLRDDTRPRLCPERKIPKSLLPKVKESLERLVKEKVIKPMNEPTDWSHPLVIAEKPDKNLRICLDPRYLNEFIVQDKHHIPTQEEMLGDLDGTSCYTILDMKESFHQVELDEETSKLLTFSTPCGKFRYLRLPYGIKTASEAFQKKNMETFGNIKGVKIYIDDIFIATSEEDHEATVMAVLQRAKDAGITFNPSKFQYKCKKVKLLGHIISKEGVEVDPKRTEAIMNMKNPENKKELLRLLGIVKYLGKFIPNLSQVSAPLRELTKDSSDWKWTDKHTQSVKLLKSLISQAPTLSHCNEESQFYIQTDACNEGLGAVLMQNGNPVAYASRSLTQSEKRYAIIEKECLAIVFALEKWHYFIYGRHVILQTDHNPLVCIQNKEFSKIPSRLQRMYLRIIKYDVKITYLPGKDMLIADALSRAALATTGKEDLELNFVIHEVKKKLPISENRLNEIKKMTNEDEILSKIIKYMSNGWPNKTYLTSAENKFYNIKDFLTIYDDLIFYEDRLVIPSKFQPVILKTAHEGHQGITRTKLKVRESLYWPGMSKNIKDMILNCEICQQLRPQNCKMPLMNHSVPELPWRKLGMDILDFKGKSYLVVVDYTSKWIELFTIRNKSVLEVINKLKIIFSYHGYPRQIVSDNVPFNSKDFRDYMDNHDITLVTSSPNFPRSNGQAESAVKSAKRMLRKSDITGCSLPDLLLDYRNTPIPELNLSPAQILMSRRLRDNIIKTEGHLKPTIVKPSALKHKQEVMHQRQREWYNRSSKNLKPVKEKDKVHFQKDNKWQRGTLKKCLDTPRSYIVQSDDGPLYRRTREHIIRTDGDGQLADVSPSSNTPQQSNPLPVNAGSPRHYDLRDRTKIKKPLKYQD